ncbi:period circadian protein isoform X2 [Homalodisca vitripennis]|uniref:period circadian protein isoform X2 n=1 Tax=Homalodisca vitripennis TaxID=197043 RepID=UPI001EEA96F3|nr:period circadian protein isoform X2 [Homalodisca vitripennis]
MSSDKLSIAMATNVSENEETETHKTKVSDSGYSNSCSNSQSQRSNSSKSRHSTSSGSSGYCGHPSSTLGSSGDENLKKKKPNSQVIATTVEDEEVSAKETSFTPPHPAEKIADKKKTPACVDPSVLDNMSSPTVESEALQVAVLAQTLYCLQNKANEKSLDEQDLSFPPPPANKELQKTEMVISDFKDDTKHEKEFCIVVTLSDGTVVCTTPTLTKVLGFPKDMWIGRSLITFMHPKDRLAFAGHITSAMARAHSKQKETGNNCNDNSEHSDYFYCWIRLYHGLKTGFNVTDKKASYLPCQLSMNFKEVPDQGVFLVATARVVKSAYKVPDEKRSNPPTFTIRHKANTLISHVDDDIVPHFGYKPHDMIGRSVFDFYYAEDLPYLKDVYTNVVKEEGLLFLSRPYKFRCQNGDSVTLETEWSSFINPWGKNLEFIIGRHKVLIGPHNPDVTSPVLETEQADKEEDENNTYKDEVTVLLTEPIVRCYEPSKQQLAQLVESLEKISSSQLCGQPTGAQVPATASAPVPSATSEMLGEISPHHVYSDSKSSSETPSYNQLTYNENIQRFFASEPKTTGSDEFQDTKNERNQSSSSGGEEGKSLPNNSSFNNSDSFLNGSGKSSMNSASARQQCQMETVVQPPKSNNVDNKDYKSRSKPLTEEMLYQHNENMNKQMAQKHKKEKSKSQVNRKHKNVRHKTQEENEQEDQGGHGMKRSVSNSWEGEPVKAFKGAHREQPAMVSHSTCVRMRPAAPPGVWPSVSSPLAGHMNYPSPLVNPLIPCVYMNPLPAVPPAAPTVCGLQIRPPVVTQPSENPAIVPPSLQHRPPVVPAPQPYLTHQVQYMPSLMYQLPLVPMVYTQSHVMSPTIKPRMAYMSSMTPMTTVLQPELSDSSKKENKSRASSPVFSPGGFTSNTGKTKTGTFDNDLTHDDTSYCSYTSSFLKTDKSDDSMKGAIEKAWCKMASSDSTPLRTVRKEPSWMENVELTPELLLRYKMNTSGCILNDVLQSDCQTLLKYHQSDIVNEQLDQLYMSLEGFSKHLALEDSFPSSSSSGDEKNLVQAAIASTSTASLNKPKKRRRFMAYEKYSMVFEEDAPLPPSLNEMIARTAQSS